MDINLLFLITIEYCIFNKFDWLNNIWLPAFVSFWFVHWVQSIEQNNLYTICKNNKGENHYYKHSGCFYGIKLIVVQFFDDTGDGQPVHTKNKSKANLPITKACFSMAAATSFQSVPI